MATDYCCCCGVISVSPNALYCEQCQDDYEQWINSIETIMQVHDVCVLAEMQVQDELYKVGRGLY